MSLFGKAIGNSVEIEEAVEALNGNMEEDVKNIVLTIASYILKFAGVGDNLEENKKKAMENIENGKAYRKFVELVAKQGGDINYLTNIPKAKYICELKAEENGFVVDLDAEKCGRVSLEIGAGRITKEDKIDHEARNYLK